MHVGHNVIGSSPIWSVYKESNMELKDIIIPSEEEIKQNLGRGKDIRNNNPFGNLIALYPLKERLYGKEVQWHCYNTITKEEVNVRVSSLTSGKVNGKQKDFSEIVKIYNKNKMKDLSNQRFGKLKVLEPTENRDSRRCVIWKCICDCGNEHYVSSFYLTQGKTQSCGCLTQSHGELKIEQLLKEFNMDYKKEYAVKIDNNWYRFDFAILKNNQIQYLIEFDGEQHYKDNSHFLWNSSDKLKDIQKRDNIKNNYCQQNNIPLIRIPYTHKNIKIEDLIINDSIYLYKF